MKHYSNLLAKYLLSRREGDHALALQLAGAIGEYWSSRNNTVEVDKWRKVQAEHLAHIA